MTNPTSEPGNAALKPCSVTRGTTVDPMFQSGRVPSLPHCEIQEREEDRGGWRYYIYNHYNVYASGWASEDFIISEIGKSKHHE